MAVTIYGVAAFLSGLIVTGWTAHDYVILRPEVVALHAAQEQEIVLAGSKADYLMDARIAQLHRELGALIEKARRGQASPYELQRIQDLKAELEALRRAKAGK